MAMDQLQMMMPAAVTFAVFVFAQSRVVVIACSSATIAFGTAMAVSARARRGLDGERESHALTAASAFAGNAVSQKSGGGENGRRS